MLHAGVIVLVGGVVVLHGGVGVLTQYLLRRGEDQLQKVHGKREGRGTQTRLDHDRLDSGKYEDVMVLRAQGYGQSFNHTPKFTPPRAFVLRLRK